MKQKNRTKKMKLITKSAPMSFMSLAPVFKATGTDPAIFDGRSRLRKSTVGERRGEGGPGDRRIWSQRPNRHWRTQGLDWLMCQTPWHNPATPSGAARSGRGFFRIFLLESPRQLAKRLFRRLLGLVSLFRLNASPIRPNAISKTPAIISQCGYSSARSICPLCEERRPSLFVSRRLARALQTKVDDVERLLCMSLITSSRHSSPISNLPFRSVTYSAATLMAFRQAEASSAKRCPSSSIRGGSRLG